MGFLRNAGLAIIPKSLLGGSWVVITRVISRVTMLITHIRGLKTPLITTPEPPSNHQGLYMYYSSWHKPL